MATSLICCSFTKTLVAYPLSKLQGGAAVNKTSCSICSKIYMTKWPPHECLDQ